MALLKKLFEKILQQPMEKIKKPYNSRDEKFNLQSLLKLVTLNKIIIISFVLWFILYNLTLNNNQHILLFLFNYFLYFPLYLPFTFFLVVFDFLINIFLCIFIIGILIKFALIISSYLKRRPEKSIESEISQEKQRELIALIVGIIIYFYFFGFNLTYFFIGAIIIGIIIAAASINSYKDKTEEHEDKEINQKYDINSNGYYIFKDSGKLVHRHIAKKYICDKNRDKYPLKFSFYEVHHINGNKKDNRPENLLLLTRDEHAKMHPGNPHFEYEN